MSLRRRIFHSVLSALALTLSTMIELGRFGVPVPAFIVVTAAGLAIGVATVRVRAHGCLVPFTIFVVSLVVFGVLIDRSGQWGPLQYGWLPAVLAGGLLGRVLIQKSGRRRVESLDSALRTAGRQWCQEIGPLLLCVAAFSFTVIGAIQHGQGGESLRYDDSLRASGAVVTGEVIKVEDQYFPAYKGRGHTEYTPVTRQRIDGVEYETTLDEYAVSSEPDYYRVGQRLQIMYDPLDPHRAGVRSADLRAMFQREVDGGRGAFYTASPLFVIAVPLLIAQAIAHIVLRTRTRDTRRWSAARRTVLSARRRARRLEQGAESAHRAGR